MAGRQEDSANRDRLEAFERYRRLLFSIAFSILGLREEAEELLREVRHRWLRGAHSGRGTAKTLLVTDIANSSLDRLQSIYQIKQRTPSCPFSADGAAPAECSLSTSSSFSSAGSASRLALMALDGLAPAERSVFLLRKIFSLDYSEIGRICNRDESECRSIIRNAKRSITKSRSAINLLKRS